MSASRRQILEDTINTTGRHSQRAVLVDREGNHHPPQRGGAPPSLQRRETIAGIAIRPGGTIERGGAPVGLPTFVGTFSCVFETIPGMSLPFKLDRESPVQVLFQGRFEGVESTASAGAIVRLTIDGLIVDSAVAGRDHGTALETFCFKTYSAPLALGWHKAKVLWHAFPVGERIWVGERSLVLLLPST